MTPFPSAALAAAALGGKVFLSSAVNFLAQLSTRVSLARRLSPPNKALFSAPFGATLLARPSACSPSCDGCWLAGHDQRRLPLDMAGFPPWLGSATDDKGDRYNVWSSHRDAQIGSTQNGQCRRGFN